MTLAIDDAHFLALAETLARPAPALSDEAFYGLFLSSQTARTRCGYDASVRDFAAFLGREGQRSMQPVDVVRILRSLNAPQANAILTGYRVHLVAAGRAAATVNVRLAGIRALTVAARRYGLLDWRIDVSGVRSRSYRDTAGPGHSNFLRIVVHVEGMPDSAKKHRDLAILRLLFSPALRRGELVELDMHHVDLSDRGNGTAVIKVRGKGHNDLASLTIPPSTAVAVRDWIAARGAEPGPLFVNLDHGSARGRLSATSVYRIVRGYGEELGIRVRPHGIRHTAISRAAEKTNGNLVKMAKFSRHRDFNTVKIYLDNLRDEGGEIARLVSDD
jgi:integrase/recombinase XerC